MRIRHALTMLALGLSACTAPQQTAPLSEQSIKRLAKATGIVMAVVQMTNESTVYCARNFHTLAADARKAHNNWHQRNAHINTRAQHSLQRITRQLRHEHGRARADQLLAQIQQFIDIMSARIMQRLKTESRNSRHQACQDLMRMMRNGQWDIRQRFPDAYRTLI